MSSVPYALAINQISVVYFLILSIFNVLKLGAAWKGTFTGEALEVEVLVLHSEHLTLAWLPTLVTLNQRLLCGGVVCVLRMSHCKRRDKSFTISLS